ncbi:MAG: cyclic nucleotide-binding domain-containing protein [Syntrophobacteraceae bacterium]|jgi:CRP-like cAMP-binding protein
MKNMIEKEELLQNYLDQGNKEAAIKLLFELAVDCAKEKNFEAAESMRSRIFEIDAMALNEIIRSGEIIEEEKSLTIDRGHREIWAKLYDSLSVEEANALYFACKKASYQAEEKIFQQDEWKPRLYFINSGRARIVYFQDGKEVFLKAVEAGELAGEDTFFSLSICTTIMIAQYRTEVSYLDSDILRVWKTGCPVLESKLRSFASSVKKIADLLKARKMDRRHLKRVHPGGKAIALLMNPSEQPVGKPFKVDLCDISRGGICFLVKITKRETGSLLLGKRLFISYLHPMMDSSRTIKQIGTIVAVGFHPFEDCTVNVKFDALLPRELIEQLEKLSPPSRDFDF